ncbi:ammonia-dependent NAD(+) synthetase [Entomomonas asaccharolytica]|uniref:NH(3)-dependent NAD(+) synthetase n=1 Tax=Entomomonas asaccharolytica TaxID=2785331 RepID=A0A974NDQ8_9GAMM|nr:ammonia-dependent NAD(+) synthetase [Entomomonas asaccharolytica]QQP84582.1 ammonia-dependent NAD(+) synthetase [Entomomonas asaccharolytica]
MIDQLTVQREIAQALNVCTPFADEQALVVELERRIIFLKRILIESGLKTYVLGISGGVDSLTAGMMAQRAVRALREETGDTSYRFIAMRLPYKSQADEAEATQSVQVIAPDHCEVVNIAASVEGMVGAIDCLQQVKEASRDFIIGNIKARARMIAQYAVANVYNGLVIGTDHAAEAVMGFYTKFGDGAFDVGPLIGLVKGQVRALASYMGAPDNLVNKVPTADLEDLKPGLPDEQAHGVAYTEIDAFLQGKPVSAEAFKKITETYNRSMHKRQLPIAP